MHHHYIFIPQNPNLSHCSDTFSAALKTQPDSIVHALPAVNLKSAWTILKQILQSSPDDRTAIFLLAVRSDYLALLCLLKLTTLGHRQPITAYYLMHEPRLKPGETHPFKSKVIFLHQLLFGYLADTVLLPSDEAVAKAATFVEKTKIRRVNLTFPSVPEIALKQTLEQLRQSWDCKTFAMLGTLSKNPQGFVDFAHRFQQVAPNQARFIRGGRDRNIDLQYSQEIIQFPCYLSETSKKFLFNLSHFIIIPYAISTQSGVIAEALSYGKFVIVNNIPAFQYLKDAAFAFVIDFNQPGEIAACVQRIVEMQFEQYETGYWASVDYFQKNHSEFYLAEQVKEMF
jgi:glycosyltransferase involved in cell wall biosynthesis